MEGSGILELREAAEEEIAEKDQQKLEKENAKKSKKENFIQCKEWCICNEKICKAAGLKECSVCGDVMKSQCSKARCTVVNIRPLMKLPWFDVEKKLNRSTAARKKKSRSKIIKECAISTDESDYCDSEEDEGEEEEEELLLSEGEEGEGEEEVTDLQQASCSKVLDEDEIEYCDVKAGMWVVVVYEEERFIGKVQHKKAGEVNVRCLEKPLGINLPQLFEPGERIYYAKMYRTDIRPSQTQTDEDGKQKRKWFWVY